MVDIIIDELINLCSEKYRLISHGHDTLQLDVLFIEKFKNLKDVLKIEILTEKDFANTPKMKVLQKRIEEINKFEDSKNNRNVRMLRASKAYKK